MKCATLNHLHRLTSISHASTGWMAAPNSFGCQRTIQPQPLLTAPGLPGYAEEVSMIVD